MGREQIVVIGAGHAGLAVSHQLARKGVDHIVVDKDGVASNWRKARWDSFTLLTPNWATWLPGWNYTGDDPHGFMDRAQVSAYLADYANSFSAPVHSGVEVTGLAPHNGGFRVSTSVGGMAADAVVVATGPFQIPKIPPWAAAIPSSVTQLHSSQYRSPAALPEGRVLVVGSGPSGQQIAEELIDAGRSTYLSVGRHRRVPRRYRGRDYYWWREMGGSYEKTAEDVPVSAQRDAVAPALTGGRGGHDLDLRELHSRGLALLGRALDVVDGHLSLRTDLDETLADGDRAYDDFAEWVDERLYRFEGLYQGAEPRASFPDPPRPAPSFDLREVSTVIWATGFRLDFQRWLPERALDTAGYPRHHRGVSESPGLYFIGLPWLHRLRSPFIRGASEDASHIVGSMLP